MLQAKRLHVASWFTGEVKQATAELLACLASACLLLIQLFAAAEAMTVVEVGQLFFGFCGFIQNTRHSGS